MKTNLKNTLVIAGLGLCLTSASFAMSMEPKAMKDEQTAAPMVQMDPQKGEPMVTVEQSATRYVLQESLFSVDQTVDRLEKALKAKGIQVFAKFDHAKNAKEVGLALRPTTVLVFGSPKVGTEPMTVDQSVALELPLKMAVWEDAQGKTQIAFPRMDLVAQDYAMPDNAVLIKMMSLLEDLAKTAGQK